MSDDLERPEWQRHSDPWGEAHPGNPALAVLREAAVGVESVASPPTQGGPLSKLTDPQTKTVVKPGLYSTEFWLTVAADVVGVLNADKVWTFLPPHDAGVLMTAVTGLYALSRGWAKSGS